MDETTYSDETTTGEGGHPFRGVGRATIAARVWTDSGFDWLRALRSEYLPLGVEPKANLVLQLADSSATVRSLVEKGVGSSTIAIIDLGEIYREQIAWLTEALGEKPPTRLEALRLATDPSLRGEIVRKLLTGARTNALHHTIVPRIERMLRSVAKAADLEPGADQQLFDREVLKRLDQRGFQEVVARFTLALGDALAPDRWRNAVVAALEDTRFLSAAYVAFHTLGEAVGIDRYYDIGNVPAFASVESAHTTIVNVLEEANARFFAGSVRAGRLRQEDSAALLGLQAADIAARYAARIYERYPDDRLAGAHAVKHYVDQVLLNDEWI